MALARNWQLLASLVMSLFIAGMATGHSALQPGNPRGLPHLVIWSWEHADNFEYVDPNKVAVAYLAGTVVIRHDRVTFKKRMNPVSIPQNAQSFPVFRVETVHGQDAPTQAAIESAVDLILSRRNADRCHQLQVDFDATTTERKAYLELLRLLRKRLPFDCNLSITALASWCLGDKWLQQAPVDETVAMMFCMGSGKEEALSAIRHQHLDSGAACKQSLGIAVCETDTNSKLHQLGLFGRCDHLYAFSPLGWTKRRYERLLAEINDQ